MNLNVYLLDEFQKDEPSIEITLDDLMTYSVNRRLNQTKGDG